MIRLLLALLLVLSPAFSGLVIPSAAAQSRDNPADTASLQDADEVTMPRPNARYGGDAPLPFELFRGSRMFFRGSINGTPTEMMLDTGASSTVLDTAFARRLGIVADRKLSIRGADDSVPGEVASDITIVVGNLTLTGASVLIMDLGPVSAAIGRPIPVVLGHEAIDAGPMRIDFPARTMTFLPKDAFKAPADATELTLGHDGPLRSVKVSVAGLPDIDATFDIGNGGAIVLAKSYWENQPSIARLPGAEGQIGGVGGFKPMRRVTLPEVTFAGRTLKSVPAALNEAPDMLPLEGANVGIELLKPFVVTVDYANDKLYFERTAAEYEFRRDRGGAMLRHQGDRLIVRYVSADGPAAAAGLKVGDEIVAINGRPIGSDFNSLPEADWAVGAAGTPVVMARADGSEVTVTLRDYF